MKRIDLIGKRFGRLVVVANEPSIGRGRKTRAVVRVVCDCGTSKSIRSEGLRLGNTKSCGCLADEVRGKHSITHGLSNSRLYAVWQGIRKRCYQSASKQYAYYGGRGIVMCERWHDFTLFAADMEPGYSPGTEIDRIDNDGIYEPANCRWVTRKEQARNRRSNVMLTMFGKTKCLLDWSAELGFDYDLALTRISHGWDKCVAIAMPRLRTAECPFSHYRQIPDEQIRSIWRQYGWTPNNRVLVTTTEVREAA